ncbi:MAG: DnaA N-terminal domain-containing protein [Nitrospinales bacterium]
MNVLWKKCLDSIEKQVLPEDFTTWFLPTYPFSRDEDRLNIAVPNEFFKR